jgi:hypothetical protein
MVVQADLRRIDPPSARHSKVEDQRITATGVDQAVLCSPSKTRNYGARQALPQIGRECAPKVRSPHLNGNQPTSFKHRG